MMTHNIVGAQLAARIFGIALAALYLAAPSTALAQNDCGGDPTLDVGDDTYNCPDASYPNGVTYEADGNLTVNFTNGGTTEVESGGIDLSATGSDGVTFDSATSGTEVESRETVGALLGVTTVDGDIDIDTEEVDADAHTPTNVTHAIFAENTGTGSIDINTTGIVDAQGSNPANAIGIEAITGSGNLTVTFADAVRGNDAAIDATTGTGLLTINIASGGSTNGAIRTNAGGDAVINVVPGAALNGNALDLTVAGEMTLNNDGTIDGALDFSGLDNGYTFNNNAGAVWDADTGSLGAVGSLNNAGTIELGTTTLISAPGSTFTGTGNSRLEFLTVLDGDSRLSCSAAADATGTERAAGCLDLTGGATAGQTGILVTTVNNPDPFLDPIDTSVSAGVVLVDVSGGTSAAEHFVLDSGSDNYAEDSKYGSVITTGGLFDYTLLYNPEKQQHVLASVPQKEGVEYTSFIHQALSVWHTTSDAVAGRQADLRNRNGAGGWFRVISEQAERDAAPTLTTHGNNFTYDQEYSFRTTAGIAGYDLMATEEYVLGVHGGIVSGDSDFRDSSTGDDIRGTTAGVYGGWWRNGLTLDGTFNVNMLEIDRSVRDGLEDSKTDVVSLGARAEAGYQAPLMGEALYLQPLVTLAYMRADIENLELRDYDLRFEGDESLRSALGIRVGGNAALQGGGKLGYWLTARRWEEHKGEGSVQFATGGDPLVIEDDLGGTFEEIGLGASVSNAGDTLSGFISASGKSADDLDDSFSVTIGARMRW